MMFSFDVMEKIAMNKIKVIVNGALGKMGQESVKALQNHPMFELVAEGTRQTSLTDLLTTHQPDIVIDFTNPESVFENTLETIKHRVHPIIGTTGLNQNQINQLKTQCDESQLGAIIAPNFCLAAALMVKFAATAAAYLPNVEIIEYHHDKKKDSPSGTAVKTAQIISQHRKSIPVDPTEKENVVHCRGGIADDIHIHAVRLPGFMASQEIIFGNLGERLSIRHDSINREAYMPGLLFACEQVVKLKSLVYGLENLLFS